MTLDQPSAGGTGVEDLRSALRALHLAAGRPSARSISRALDQAVSHTTIADLLNGRRIPSWAITQRVVAHLNGDEGKFRYLWGQASEESGATPAARILAGPPAGQLLDELTDPFALEVHRPVQADDPQPELPVLPAYVPREHDQELARVVRTAADGTSGIAVLVGGSSTGKTRACWEALGMLRDRTDRWRLWHPLDPSRPEAALRELPMIGPHTIIWLNEAQFYLDVANGGLGDRVAAGLRGLLRAHDRAPVLVLATLWPQFWDRLTTRPQGGAPDPHAQARELLVGHDISVPAAFTTAQLPLVAATGDPRLALAARAEDGRVIQFLAGAPELLARYRNAPPAAAALISAAMDARRLGVGISLPLSLLAAAAPGYLADADWDALGEDWLEQALAFTAAPCKGARGPLARIRPRVSARAAEPAYRLADYLEQYGRQARRQYIPPASFWTATAHFASPGDLPTLAEAAENRGLLRDAARLRKCAAEQGNVNEAAALVRGWHYLYPDSDDPMAAQWAAHASLDDPHATVRLLDALREAGAHEQVAVLAARAAAHTSLDDPHATVRLLGALREAGAHEQVAVLAARAAAHTSLDDPHATVRLLGALRQAGADEQSAVLLLRNPAAQTSLENPNATVLLLGALREAGAHEQVAALAARAAAHASLNDEYGAVQLLGALRHAGAEEQAVALAHHAAVHAPLDDPGDVATLLDALREAGAEEQGAALLTRDPAGHVPLDDPGAVAELLDALREAGAEEQGAALLARDPAGHVPLDDPGAVAELLDALRWAGAEEPAVALARRAVHVPLDDPGAVAELLDALRWAGAEKPAVALARRAVHVPLDDPGAVAELLDALREAGEEKSAVALARRAAVHVPLDDPFDVARLLNVLRSVGTQEQDALLAREPAAHVSLDDPGDVAGLLTTLRDAGAEEQVRTLVNRLPGEGHFGLFREQIGHQMAFRFGREPDGSPAPSWDWDDLD